MIFPKKLRGLSLLCSSMLVLTACSTEYSASEISVSDQGAFVERGSDDKLDGAVVIEKNTGERLSVEFSDGMPSGDVEMHNASGDLVLRSHFVAKDVQRSGSGFMNEILEKNAASLGTNDYLDLFEEFAEYDGDYLKIDSNNKKTNGHYDKGEKDGRWQVYCDNAQLQSDRTFARKPGDDDDAALIKVADELVNTCNGDVLLLANRDKQGRLQGAYVENSSGSRYGSDDSSDKPLPKYQRNYIDGEFDGEQKEFDRYGLIRIENQFKNGVKQGVEKIYSSSQNYQTKAQEHWLAEVKNYTNGQLNGSYTRFDKQQQPLESGQYENDQATGTWALVNYSRHTQQFVDFDSANFILEKAKAFKQACYLPQSSFSGTVSWAGRSQGDLANCEYYVENSVVDINKKLALDVRGPFEKSGEWTYAAITAAPKTYAYMKKHGLKTRVSDSRGRTRLHACLTQLRKQNRRSVPCTAEQAIAYIADVDVDQVSNIGTALYQLALERNSNTGRPAVVNAELKIAKALIDNGADVDKVNLKKKTPLMFAVGNREYALAEMILDAGASVSGVDSQGLSALSYFFLGNRNRWLKSKVSAQGTRVLAKMIALGVDTDAVVFDNKTIRDLSEEHNSLHHIQTLKDANAMSSQFKDTLNAEFSKRQKAGASDPKKQTLPETDALAGVEESYEAETLIDANASIEEPVIGSNASTQAPATLGVSANQAVAPSGAPSEATPQSGEQTTAAEPEIFGGEVNTPSVNDSVLPVNQAQSAQGEASTKAEQLLQKQADFLVAQAYEHIENFRLKTPKSNSALGSLEQLKLIDPESASVAEVEKAIGEKYLSLASSKITQGDKAGAQKHLNSATTFIRNKAQLSEYQTRVDSTQVKRAKPVAAAKPSSSNNSSNNVPAAQSLPIDYVCKPVVKIKGLPLLGRTLTATQSLPLSKQYILSKSLPWVQSDYSNVKQQNDRITFEQATKRTPITFELKVTTDGNNTQLSLLGKTPKGLVIKKSDYKNTFCELLATFQ